LQRGVLGRKQLPGFLRQDGQGQQAGREKACVEPTLCAPPKTAGQHVRTEIAEEQHDLEKQQAYRPYSRGSAKPRKDFFRDERFHQKEEERTQKNGEGMKHRQAGDL